MLDLEDKPVHGRCQCCGRQTALVAPRVPGGLPATAKMCSACNSHFHKAQHVKELEHFDMYEQDSERRLAMQANGHQVTVDSLSEQISALETKLAERPVNVVVENLDKVTVDTAKDERDAAYRSRDSAFQDISSIRLMHRPTGKQCVCGLRLNSCRTYLYLRDESGPALDKWEKKQIKRVQQDLPTALPEHHPLRSNPTWRWS